MTPWVKDCACLTHGDYPHWVHADRIWRESNRELLAVDMRRYGAPGATYRRGIDTPFLGYATAERERLAEKRRTMEVLHVDRITSEVVTLAERDIIEAAHRCALAEEADRRAAAEGRDPERLRDRLRAASLAMENAASDAERTRYRAEMERLDTALREVRVA